MHKRLQKRMTAKRSDDNECEYRAVMEGNDKRTGVNLTFTAQRPTLEGLLEAAEEYRKFGYYVVIQKREVMPWKNVDPKDEQQLGGNGR